MLFWTTIMLVGVTKKCNFLLQFYATVKFYFALSYLADHPKKCFLWDDEISN